MSLGNEQFTNLRYNSIKLSTDHIFWDMELSTDHYSLRYNSHSFLFFFLIYIKFCQKRGKCVIAASLYFTNKTTSYLG